jgi:RND superfamily putative drug exporter
MFQRLGNVVSSGWWVFLLIWGLVLGGLIWMAPPWNEVILEGEFVYLPESLPSRHGEKMFREAFPRQFFPSNVVLVLVRKDGEISAQDRKFVKQDLQPGLEKIIKKDKDAARGKAKPIIGAFHSPLDQREGPLLMSEDGKAALMILELRSELLEMRNWPIMAQIDALLAGLKKEGKIPDGLEISEEGSASVGRDVSQGQEQSARNIHKWTVVLVVVLLVILYRALRGFPVPHPQRAAQLPDRPGSNLCSLLGA